MLYVTEKNGNWGLWQRGTVEHANSLTERTFPAVTKRVGEGNGKENGRARRWCNLHCPQGCRLILARSLFSSISRNLPATNQITQWARAMITDSFNAVEKSRRYKHQPGNDNAGWRVIARQKRNTIYARRPIGFRVRALKCSFRGNLHTRGLSHDSAALQILTMDYTAITKTQN